ncbi:hypothetical protein IJ425_03530 [bacterium]|nr:hypothetical protein [bacterium]
MNINNISSQVNFKSINLDMLSKGLYTLNNNDMLNAAAVDLFATDTQRTIIETKRRGKNAGIEMGFREFTGTFIVEFSATLFALLSSKIFAKKYKPKVKINPNSWLTNKAIDTFSDIYNNSDKSVNGFIIDTLNSMSGLAGKRINYFSDVEKEKTKPIVDKFIEIIENPVRPDKKTIAELQDDIISVLKADNEILIKGKNKQFSDNLTHIVRDIVDVSRNVFFKNGIDSNETIKKLKQLNKSRVAFAIPLSLLLAISNQKLNRYLTKRRTGIDNFVGENGYENNVKNQNETKKEKGLGLKKAASVGVFLTMLLATMGVKKPIDLIKNLEFSGPATSGNTIKTIYGTLITGRLLASKDSTELRETVLRDYLGFLNWLVLGGFVAKGVGQILDPKMTQLFNISKEGKGIKHWLKDISLKSQKEIIAQGGNIKKNLKNLNIAQISGIAYSAIMLGILLPKLNIALTQNKKDKPQKQDIKTNPFIYKNTPEIFKGFLKQENFMV